MKLTLELTDEQVVALRDTLKISTEDMDRVASGVAYCDERRLQYARRIIQARHVLKLSVNFRDACEDYIESGTL